MAPWQKCVTCKVTAFPSPLETEPVPDKGRCVRAHDRKRPAEGSRQCTARVLCGGLRCCIWIQRALTRGRALLLEDGGSTTRHRVGTKRNTLLVRLWADFRYNSTLFDPTKEKGLMAAMFAVAEVTRGT